MKKYRRILISIILLHVLMILVITFSGKTDYAFLSGENVIALQSGWTLVDEGNIVPIETLPYQGSSEAGETIVLKRQIPLDYLGKTLFFFTMETELTVRMDGEIIYSFGSGNSRLFGRTPGSRMNFVDLPAKGSGFLEVELTSPYRDYAATIKEIRLADRDKAVLQVLWEKMPELLCSILLLFSGCVMMILAVMQGMSKRQKGSMVTMGLYLSGMAVVYVMETQVLHIWFGGQAILSYLLGAIFMCAPLLLLMYYMETRHFENSKGYMLLVGIVCLNIPVQIVIQLTGLADLTQLTVVSHLLLLLCITAILLSIYYTGKRKDQPEIFSPECIGLLVVGITTLMDLCRCSMYIVADQCIFGRWGDMFYGMILVWGSMKQIVNSNREEEQEHKLRLEEEVERKTRELRDSQEQTEKMLTEMIDALSNTVDAKDRYTSGHSKRVAQYARILAERMGLNKEQQKRIYIAGLLHDVGKIRIPDEIINKPGKLTDEEFNYIKLHSITGYHILKEISSIEGIAEGAKFHHERFDGKGYPVGLEGENIPLMARIIGVADSYDAMASNRSYRKALPQYIVREEIVKGRGTQFDPEIADKMIELIDEDKNYEMKQTDSLQKMILVVDDEPVNIKIVEYILKDEPMYTVLYCYDGVEALKILEEERIDLLLLDIEMPEMNGMEVMKEIRKRKIDVEVAFMSADKDFELIQHAIELGVGDYLTKPFMPIELKEVVHSLIE